MSRADSCVEALHAHVGQCQRAGYANGRQDVIDAVRRLADEWSVLIDYVDDPESTADQRARSRAGVIAAEQIYSVLDNLS